MAHRVNRQILLKSRPEGAPSLDNFELTESPVREPGEGEVLTRTLYLSLDPYMRGRMSAAKSYAKPAEVGQPMVVGTKTRRLARKPRTNSDPIRARLPYVSHEYLLIRLSAGCASLD